MRIFRLLANLVLFSSALSMGGCLTPEEEFVGDRLMSLCNDSYPKCNYLAGCILDGNHYIEGAFPGLRRVVVKSEKEDTEYSVRIFFRTMVSSGTEFLINLYESDCTIDYEDSRVQWLDMDIFDKSGDDSTLEFTLKVSQKGEHLLEIYSDSTAEYLLIAEK